MTRGRPATPLGTYGTIHTKQLPSGKWEARARTRQHNGTTTDTRARGASKTQAVNNLKTKLATLTTPTTHTALHPASTTTQACTYWISQKTNIRPQSAHTYTQAIKLHITPNIGNIRLNELTPSRLDTFMHSLTPGAGATVHTVLKQTLNLCQRLGVLPTNPIDPIPKPRAPKQQARALTTDELTELRATIHRYGSQRLTDIFELCLHTGLRIGEALALQWDQIDLDATPPTLTVNATLEARTNTRQAMPKTASSVRTLELPSPLVAIFQRRRGYPCMAYTPLVFPSDALTPISEANFNRDFRKAKGDKYAWVGIHTLRRTIATMIANGGNVQAAAAVLGHESTIMTERRYVQRGTSSVPEDVLAILDSTSSPAHPHESP